MSRYVIEFAKQGYIKYISHLDMQRLFKRAFKRAGIPIEYSQGYNPHPKIGFAQPLALGYTACQEYLEFNTTESIELTRVISELREAMPQGVDIININELDIPQKSLASAIISAVYEVKLPITYKLRHKELESYLEGYLNQEEIIAQKREKKTKKLVDKDIKSQIRSIIVTERGDGYSALEMELDTGSSSNLSPEQVINSFAKYSSLYLPREEIEVERKYLIFDSCIPQTAGLHLSK